MLTHRWRVMQRSDVLGSEVNFHLFFLFGGGMEEGRKRERERTRRQPYFFSLSLFPPSDWRWSNDTADPLFALYPTRHFHFLQWLTIVAQRNEKKGLEDSSLHLRTPTNILSFVHPICNQTAHVDLAFNDAFMRHIYKKMMSPSWEPLAYLSSLLSRSTTHTPRSPTHVSILGDLFSSQWIDDTEFDVRVARYRSIFPDPSLSTSGSVARTVGAGDGSSVPVMINITGNHDIGYGYDISQDRVERWEQVFGKSNFISSVDIPTAAVVGSENDTDSRRMQSSNRSETRHGSSRKLHLVVLNTMLLDGPSSDEVITHVFFFCTFERSISEISLSHHH